MLLAFVIVASAALLLSIIAIALDVHHTALTRDRIVASERRLETWQNLHACLKFRAPLPLITDYTASPQLLLFVVQLISELAPRRVVELGSGLSTLVIAYAMERFAPPGYRVLSVDHDARFAAHTALLLEAHGASANCTVRHAPLEPVATPVGSRQWYSLSAFDDAPIDLLIVDGPPGKAQPMARFPAAFALRDRLTAAAVVVLDDARRPDERRAAEAWAELLDAELASWDAGKGIALLRRRARAPGGDGEGGEPVRAMALPGAGAYE